MHKKLKPPKPKYNNPIVNGARLFFWGWTPEKDGTRVYLSSDSPYSKHPQFISTSVREIGFFGGPISEAEVKLFIEGFLAGRHYWSEEGMKEQRERLKRLLGL